MYQSQSSRSGSSRWTNIRRRLSLRSDMAQAGIVMVVAFSVLASIIGAVIVRNVIQSDPLYQAQAVQIYAHRALEAGENAYQTAVNANPSLAQCNTNTNSSGTCGGLDYGQWNVVNGSNASGADLEYYAFGNPQPTFSSTTNALTSLTVQVVGAAYDPAATNHYLFDQESLTVAPSNGFLQNVWWSNYESYNPTGSYTSSNCNYNWSINYNIDNQSSSYCSPVYFGPLDYLFGPVYSNDSIFVSGNGGASSSPSFGTSTSPSAVTTADPNCLFVDDTHGMSGSDANCSNATNDVDVYDSINSSSGHAVEQPPANDTQLKTIAAENGCLYSGPTQITLSTNAGVGQMTVSSPDTTESTVTVKSVNYTVDTNNISANLNNCPNNGTASLPPNGVVFVENETTASQVQAGANPFDDTIYNTVSNLTSNPTSPTKSNPVTLTDTITSGSSDFDSGSTVSFSQTTTSSGRTSTAVINACSSQSLSSPVAVTPATSPPTYTATATCSTTESSNGTGAFSATFSGGVDTSASSDNLGGPTNVLSYSTTKGPDSQVTSGGCTSCYYGETNSPDAEGDAFVNGTLSGQLTIGTENDVIIDGNITYADCNWQLGQSGFSTASKGLCPYNVSGTNDALGLIANNYAEVNRPILASTSNQQYPTVLPSCGGTPAATCDPSDGTNGITIDAAILALTQSWVVNNYGTAGTEGSLIVYGSIQQFARGPVGTFNKNQNGTYSLSTGYQKNYTWDPLLDFVSPPSYLVPSTPSWVLQSVTTNAGVAATNVCPPLVGVYAGVLNGVSQTGPADTQYCSGSPGGLPNYPTITAPAPPTGVSATANSTGTVTVSWTDPSNNGTPITGYSVFASPACSACTYSSLTGPNVTSTTITGLTQGSTYNFTVVATNGVGSSSPSTASNAVTVPSVPSAPVNVSGTTNANGTVTVSWTDPSNNGSAITGYTVNPSPSCSTCSYTSLTGAAVTSTTVTGLTLGTAYTFTVSATNGVGTGNLSSASNAVTPATAPGAPSIGTATGGVGSASVSWSAPSNGGSAITGYVVTPYIGSAAQTAQTFVSTATTQTVTSLTNGTAYTFKVAAINAVGTGSQSGSSNSVTPAGAPSAPTIGTATSGNATATVTWTAPASNGSTITGYIVTPYIGGAAQTPQSFSSTATSETVTGLTNGTAYTFKVAAINGVGTGGLSTASNSVTPATVPGAPTGVSGTRASSGKINVSWTAPTSTGGAPISSYKVTPYYNGVAQTATTFPSAATTEQVTGLTAGRSYTFVVSAINSVGTGTPSAASGAVSA